jgi:hypothetical protein
VLRGEDEGWRSHEVVLWRNWNQSCGEATQHSIVEIGKRWEDGVLNFFFLSHFNGRYFMDMIPGARTLVGYKFVSLKVKMMGQTDEWMENQLLYV